MAVHKDRAASGSSPVSAKSMDVLICWVLLAVSMSNQASMMSNVVSDISGSVAQESFLKIVYADSSVTISIMISSPIQIAFQCMDM